MWVRNEEKWSSLQILCMWRKMQIPTISSRAFPILNENIIRIYTYGCTCVHPFAHHKLMLQSKLHSLCFICLQFDLIWSIQRYSKKVIMLFSSGLALCILGEMIGWLGNVNCSGKSPVYIAFSFFQQNSKLRFGTDFCRKNHMQV